MGRTISASSTVGVRLTTLDDRSVLILPEVTIAVPIGKYRYIDGSGSYTALSANLWFGPTVDNFGTLLGDLSGIGLNFGGAISNESSGVIAGGTAIVISGDAGTVINRGLIGTPGTSQNGILLTHGGWIDNDGGTISGTNSGIFLEYSTPGSILNQGTVTADGIAGVPNTGWAVNLSAGGVVTNGGPDNAAALLEGAFSGVWATSGSATVTNFGTIAGGPGVVAPGAIGLFGIVLLGGGTIRNEATGLVRGDQYGIAIEGAGYISNAGAVIAAAGTPSVAGKYGIELGGGALVNDGFVSGNTGVQLSGAVDTVASRGTIVGTAGTAVAGGAENDYLLIGPSALFQGVVDGRGGTNILDLTGADPAKGGSSTGMLSGIGSQFKNFALVNVEAGATWTIEGNVAGFTGGPAFAGLDAVDVLRIDGAHETIASFSGGLMQLTGDAPLYLAFVGDDAGETFAATQDAGGTSIGVACFAAGSRILTARGEVPVEAIGVGDRVVTVLGVKLAPVVWVGQREVDCARHAEPDSVWPVRVRAGAFGAGQPHRDLWLSPDHAVFVGGVLVPVKLLVNGATVVQEAVERVRYFHVELEAHDVLLADGLACESYLDTGNRAAFANGGAVMDLHADFVGAAMRRWGAAACAVLALGGAQVAAARAGLLAQAGEMGFALSEDADLGLEIGGRRIVPRATERGLGFDLPAGVSRVRLVSRSAVPAEVRVGDEDRRRLGVAVTGLALDGVAVGLGDGRLGAGWHPAEDGLRWTDGAGEIAVGGARRLEVGTAGLLRYWVEPEGVGQVGAEG